MWTNEGTLTRPLVHMHSPILGTSHNQLQKSTSLSKCHSQKAKVAQEAKGVTPSLQIQPSHAQLLSVLLLKTRNIFTVNATHSKHVDDFTRSAM